VQRGLTLAAAGEHSADPPNAAASPRPRGAPPHCRRGTSAARGRVRVASLHALVLSCWDFAGPQPRLALRLGFDNVAARRIVRLPMWPEISSAKLPSLVRPPAPGSGAAGGGGVASPPPPKRVLSDRVARASGGGNSPGREVSPNPVPRGRSGRPSLRGRVRGSPSSGSAFRWPRTFSTHGARPQEQRSGPPPGRSSWGPVALGLWRVANAWFLRQRGGR
jgi:hypothetical protein